MRKSLTLREQGDLREVQKNLRKIRDTGSAPISLVKYRNLGLISPHSKIKDNTSSFGVKDYHFAKIRLTEKGKKLLNTNI